LLEILDHEETLASICHEIAHIKNNDTLLKSISLSLKIAAFFNIIGFIVDSIFSRDREFLADIEGAKLVGNPRALISALIKLSGVESSGPNGVILGALSFSLFEPKTQGWIVFSRHPSLEERIKRLLKVV
jgi:heat shock protein HtpX